MKAGIITVSLPMEMKAALRKAKGIGAQGVQLWVADIVEAIAFLKQQKCVDA